MNCSPHQKYLYSLHYLVLFMFKRPYFKTREEEIFPMVISGTGCSLDLKVIKAWDPLFEVDYEAIITVGENVLYRGHPKEYDNLVEGLRKVFGNKD